MAFFFIIPLGASCSLAINIASYMYMHTSRGTKVTVSCKTLFLHPRGIRLEFVY